MKTFIVSYGNKVVELHKSGISLEEANHEADILSKSGVRHVRVRMEDPIHPTWPLNFDYESEKVAEEQ